MALKLYLEGMGLRSIGRILTVSTVTVLNWIRMLGRSVKTYVQANMISDMLMSLKWMRGSILHTKKNESSGFGMRSIDSLKQCLDCPLAVVERKPPKS